MIELVGKKGCDRGGRVGTVKNCRASPGCADRPGHPLGRAQVYQPAPRDITTNTLWRWRVFRGRRGRAPRGSLDRDGGKLADRNVDDGAADAVGDGLEDRARRLGGYINDVVMDGESRAASNRRSDLLSAYS